MFFLMKGIVSPILPLSESSPVSLPQGACSSFGLSDIFYVSDCLACLYPDSEISIFLAVPFGYGELESTRVKDETPRHFLTLYVLWQALEMEGDQCNDSYHVELSV